MRLPDPSRLPDLPVRAVLGEVTDALAAHGNAVLVAPPGTGKTTLVPLALAAADADQGRVLVAEPRRLATRAAAARMASLLGEPVGETVGYAVRGDSRRSDRTRIEVVTSGLLLRRLMTDPELAGVHTVLLDECHERHLDADLLLALLLDARAGLRPDLRLLATSATVATDRLAELLGGGTGAAGRGPDVPGGDPARPARPRRAHRGLRGPRGADRAARRATATCSPSCPACRRSAARPRCSGAPTWPTSTCSRCTAGCAAAEQDAGAGTRAAAAGGAVDGGGGVEPDRARGPRGGGRRVGPDAPDRSSARAGRAGHRAGVGGRRGAARRARRAGGAGSGVPLLARGRAARPLPRAGDPHRGPDPAGAGPGLLGNAGRQRAALVGPAAGRSAAGRAAGAAGARGARRRRCHRPRAAAGRARAAPAAGPRAARRGGAGRVRERPPRWWR